MSGDPTRIRRRTFLLGTSTAATTTLAGCNADPEAADRATETPEVVTPREAAEASDVEPADIRLVSLSPGDVAVAYGETLEFEVVVENAGGIRGTYEIREMVGEEVQDRHLSMLGPGETETFTGTVDTRYLAAGEHHYGYALRDEYVAASLTVTLPELEPIGLTGWGPETTDPVELAGGMVVATWRHRDDRGFFRGRGRYGFDPDGEFAATLVDVAGDGPDVTLASGVGDVDGVWGGGLPTGEYRVDVDAAGSWALELLQPRITLKGGEPLPLEVAGDAAGDWFAVRPDGQARVAAAHDGPGRFAVHAFDVDGQPDPEAPLVEAEGSVSVEQPLDAEWARFVVVDATGDWSLSFEPV